MGRMILRPSFSRLAAAILAPACALTTAIAQPAAAHLDPLAAQLIPIIQTHHGKVALYARQLNTGTSTEYHGDEVVQTASVIKLTALYEAMEQVRAGTP